MSNDGGPAFPSKRQENINQGSGPPCYVAIATEGMSLRDWFAGQALSELAPRLLAGISAVMVSQWCYDLADAMLVIRKQEDKKESKNG